MRATPQPGERVRTAAAEEMPAVLRLMDACLRPPEAPTRVWQDFPVALGPSNREGILVLEQGGRICAALACLVRPHRTSVGEIAVAAIGNVVTAPEARGRGCSRRLQSVLLDGLEARGVPLAVLWSDRPALYAGRGFRPAGVECHLDLTGWRPGPLDPPPGGAAPYRAEDAAEVERLYRGHPYRTIRRAGDSALLYGMPGTRGLVWRGAGGVPVAYLFTGKGLDFPGYVLEWGGQTAALLALLDRARRELGATRLLAPQGTESFAAMLVAGGAGAAWQPSGLWVVLSPERLGAAFAAATGAAATDAAAWLGEVDAEGLPRPGVMSMAVWGFDSS